MRVLPRTRGRILIWLKAGLTLAIMWFLLRKVDLNTLSEGLKSAKPAVLIGAVAQLLLIPLFGAMRWQIVLRCLGYDRCLAGLGRVFWIGMALNQVLPTAVGGDVVRGWMAYRDGVGLLDASVSVLVERIALLGSLLAIVVATAFLTSVGMSASTLIFAGGALLAAVVAAAAIPLGRQVLERVQHRPRLQLIYRLADGLQRVVWSRWFLILALLCGLTNLNIILAAWWIGVALDLPVEPLRYFAIVPVVTLATTIPLSIGGWGVREAATVAMLGPLVGNELALLHSVSFGVALLISSLPGLLFLIWSPTARFEARAAARGQHKENSSAI